MVTHFIIMASAYSIGKRVALEYVINEKQTLSSVKNVLDYITKQCGADVPISTHTIITESETWDSVYQKDAFFKNAILVEKKERFIQLLMADRKLYGLDVAKYILASVSCTHLKLEKLTYLCYADYLCDENKKLFEDRIFAYKYGPVVETVYENYKKSGVDSLKLEDDTKEYTLEDKIGPTRSRIIASENGMQKLSSIDRTLAKYGSLSANDLVKLTHKYNTPWNKSGAGEYENLEISDNKILKYHQNESI